MRDGVRWVVLRLRKYFPGFEICLKEAKVGAFIPDDNALAHLEAIALTASTAVAAFEPKVPGGEAKPQVWSDWADFSKRMNEFAQKTAQAVKLAKEHGKEEALSNIADALTCKSCHEIYRDEKKKK